MRFAAVLAAFACVLTVSVGCSSGDDVVSTISPPAERFVDNGNGTMTDTQTHLIWARLANCYQSTTWANAMASVAQMGNGACMGVLTDHSSPGDWRLPTVAEWRALVKPSCSLNPGPPALPDLSGDGCFFDGTRWALNVDLSVGYWSSESDMVGLSAYAMNLGNGVVGSGSIQFNGNVWPVRNGP